MSFEFETIKQKEEQIIASVDSEIGQTTPALDIAWNRIFARAISGLSKLFDKMIQRAFINFLLSKTTDLDMLNEWAGWTKTYRKEATQAVINVTGTGIGDQTITGGLSGVQYASADGQKFYFENDYIIPTSGIVDTQLTAFIAGAQANLYTGELSITAQDVNISNTLTIKDSDPIYIVGTEQESISDWRDAMSRVAKKPVTSDNFSFYHNTAREIDNIIAGYPYTEKPGQLVLYAESDSADGVPTVSQLTEILEYFDGTTDGILRLPVDLTGNIPNDATTKRFTVEASQRTLFHADVTALLPLTDSNKNAVDKAIKEYFSSRKPFIKGVSTENKGTITRQALRSVIQNTIIETGATSFYDVEITSGGIVYTEYPLGEGERAYADDTGWV